MREQVMEGRGRDINIHNKHACSHSPPKICTASVATLLQWSAAKALAMEAYMVLDRP